jgi:mannose-6-phosphate isomerase-like protein (cupin superfamily)
MFTVKTIDELSSIHDGVVKLAGAELGIESFGLQVLDFPAGFDHYPEHDHTHDGQEEVYVVLQGSGEFVIDGERVALAPGRIIRIEPESRRKVDVGPDGIRILAIGCAADRAYERPEDFRVTVSR